MQTRIEKLEKALKGLKAHLINNFSAYDHYRIMTSIKSIERALEFEKSKLQ